MAHNDLAKATFGGEEGTMHASISGPELLCTQASFYLPKLHETIQYGLTEMRPFCSLAHVPCFHFTKWLLFTKQLTAILGKQMV